MPNKPVVSRAAASFLVLATAMSAGVDLAHAQADAGSSDANWNDDIVVTANKREQSINDVGITVAVLGTEQLANRQISSLADIAGSVPSLSYTNTANGTPVFTLRGVGFYETSLGAYPTVSTYLDEVPLPFPTLATLTAFDLERIEVLKGPQGTLFGQNATGGAVNFIAAKPTRKFEAGLRVGYSRFDLFEGEAFVSGPLSDRLAARIAVKGADGGAWQRSSSRDDENGRTRYIAGRFQLAFEPSESLRFLLNVNGWKNKSDPVAPQFIGLQPQLPTLDPAVAAYPLSPERPRAADWSPNTEPRANNRLWQATLRADLDVADDITLTALTSYIEYRHRQTLDGDGMAPNNLDLPVNRGNIKSFSQELRLAQDGDELRWVIGANYGRDQVSDINTLDYSNSSAALAFGFGGSTYSNDQIMNNYAVFANAEYDLSPEFTVKGGARYTKAKRRASICNFDTSDTLLAGSFFYGLSKALSGVSSGPYTRGACFALDQNNGFAPGRLDDELNEDNISYRVGVDYRPSPNVLLYANISRAYKAGSFPSLSASTFEQYEPVVQERVQAYEGGFKFTALDGTLQLNGAAYYYDYKNKQLRSKIIDNVFGILDNLENIPKSVVKGVELEISVRPTRGLSIGIAYAYADAEVKEYVGVNAGGEAANFAHSQVPYAPKHQIGTNVDFEFPLSGGIDMQLGASLNVRSDTVAVVGGSSLYEIEDYALMDLRAGIASTDGRWLAQIWCKNIFNTYYWNNVVAGYDTVARYAGKPATYGITIGLAY
ncbi:TonB-dependent receptor [Sphingomonas bisphenolicum]